MNRPEPHDRPTAGQLAANGRGLECSKCGCRDWRVSRTTPTQQGTIIRERYCRHCGHGLGTEERPVDEW